MGLRAEEKYPFWARIQMYSMHFRAVLQNCAGAQDLMAWYMTLTCYTACRMKQTSTVTNGY